MNTGAVSASSWPGTQVPDARAGGLGRADEPPGREMFRYLASAQRKIINVFYDTLFPLRVNVAVF